ncbi:MAG: gamma-glutamylcyclotransferase [Candidatus Dadabacteria bacterium]|nr:gamma-glutamylcyclotransferase [Candidatus Dadabacteria bacterium]NIV40905.1 gamma-glutamylcyclotransferase [Candidatus Dadabacteria bacterium]NIX16155.1 gamma-glutamylcyclotransferase [Candidatus Dadabacteria bacterium]
MKYFAYGSNMNIKRMEQRGVTVYKRAKACLMGYTLRFNKKSRTFDGAGSANIVEYENGMIQGVLYEIDNNGIINLDKYESYPVEYDRRLMSVILKNGVEKEAYVYIAQATRTSDDLRPTKEYLSHLLCAEGLLSADYMSRLSTHKTID